MKNQNNQFRYNSKTTLTGAAVAESQCAYYRRIISNLLKKLILEPDNKQSLDFLLFLAVLICLILQVP
jgi:hypothetical protein